MEMTRASKMGAKLQMGAKLPYIYVLYISSKCVCVCACVCLFLRAPVRPSAAFAAVREDSTVGRTLDAQNRIQEPVLRHC